MSFFNNSRNTLAAQKKGFRSKFELLVANKIKKKLKIDPLDIYEKETIEYIQPETPKKYTPDFKLPNGIYVEVKGRWTPEDRKKVRWIMESNKDMDLRMLFQNPNKKINKGSKHTYATWCDRYGIKWAEGPDIPDSWFE